MRILYIGQYFPPEPGALPVRATQLASNWVSLGHDVTVLTAFPNHPAGKVYPGYRRKMLRGVMTERTAGFRVVRVPVFPIPNRRGWQRMISYGSFAASVAISSPLLRNYDVIVATSPPLSVALAGWWRSRLLRTPLVLEIRDLWPESLVASGMAGENSRLVGGLDRLASLLYRRAERIVTVTEAMKDSLVSRRGRPESTVDVVMAGVDTAMFRPLPDRDSIRARLGFDGRFVVAYVGTLGEAHNLEIFLRAADLMARDAPEVLFLLVGEGSARDRLESDARRRNLNNLQFMPQQPFSSVPEILNAADLCLVSLADHLLFRTVVPTKMLEYMAVGRPIIATVEGEARGLLERAGAGIAVAPNDDAALVEAVGVLKADPVLATEMGNRGREYVSRHHSWKNQAEQYLEIFEAVVAAK